MGSGQTKFSDRELEEYRDLTYLSKKEILHCWKRFYHLDTRTMEQDRYATLPSDVILTLPELQVNPFRYRICKVFSSTDDGDMTFEDFLDMMSVFSENAPRAVKIEYAFRIYDFDDDNFINAMDIKKVIIKLCGQNQLSMDHINKIVDKIIGEADLDEDNQLNFAEFEHCVEKAPDFMDAFRFRL